MTISFHIRNYIKHFITPFRILFVRDQITPLASSCRSLVETGWPGCFRVWCRKVGWATVLGPAWHWRSSVVNGSSVYKAISHCGWGFAIPRAWMIPAACAPTCEAFPSRVLLVCCCDETESVKGSGEGSTECETETGPLMAVSSPSIKKKCLASRRRKLLKETEVLLRVKRWPVVRPQLSLETNDKRRLR